MVEAIISSLDVNSNIYEEKMTITYGPIILSREVDELIIKGWKEQLYTLVCKGVVVSTKESFQFMVIDSDGISCRTSPESELFKVGYSCVTHCEASSTDETTLKLRCVDRDVRISIKDITVRDVVILLINKFRRK